MMARKFAAVVAGVVLGWSTLFAAGPAIAAEDPDPFAEVCDEAAIADEDLPATCIDGEWVSTDSMYDGGLGPEGDDFGAFFGLIIVLGLLATGIGVWWRVSTAKSIARRAGMDEGAAATMAAFTDGGLEATYLASQLRPAAPTAGDATPAPDAATRLAELQRLLDSGAISQDEYDGQRRRIIDGI